MNASEFKTIVQQYEQDPLNDRLREFVIDLTKRAIANYRPALNTIRKMRLWDTISYQLPQNPTVEDVTLSGNNLIVTPVYGDDYMIPLAAIEGVNQVIHYFNIETY